MIGHRIAYPGRFSDETRTSLTKGDENQPHPHLNPLSAGEETILFPPLQGEGQGGDGVFSGQKRRSDKTEEREPKIDIDFFGELGLVIHQLPRIRGN